MTVSPDFAEFRLQLQKTEKGYPTDGGPGREPWTPAVQEWKPNGGKVPRLPSSVPAQRMTAKDSAVDGVRQ